MLFNQFQGDQLKPCESLADVAPSGHRECHRPRYPLSQCCNLSRTEREETSNLDLLGQIHNFDGVPRTTHHESLTVCGNVKIMNRSVKFNLVHLLARVQSISK